MKMRQQRRARMRAIPFWSVWRVSRFTVTGRVPSAPQYQSVLNSPIQARVAAMDYSDLEMRILATLPPGVELYRG